MDVFQHDPRLQHIKTARKRNSFSICDECAQFKTFSFNHCSAPDEVAAKEDQQIQHVLLVATERMVATICGQESILDRVSGFERVPPVIFVTINFVISFDKIAQK
jgi:hypothetical protein